MRKRLEGVCTDDDEEAGFLRQHRAKALQCIDGVVGSEILARTIDSGCLEQVRIFAEQLHHVKTIVE